MSSRNRPGTEPRTARSPLRLRLVVAAGALLLGVVGLALALPGALDNSSDLQGRFAVASVILAIVAVTALVDLAVVVRRLRRGDKG